MSTILLMFSPDRMSKKVFEYLCKNGHLTEAQLLLNHPNSRWKEDIYRGYDIFGMAFMLACKNGHLQVAQWILTCKYSQLSVAQWILTITSNVTIMNDAFVWACCNGHLLAGRSVADVHLQNTFNQATRGI